MHVDHYGNIKINNNCKNFQIGDIIRVSSKDSAVELPFVRTFTDVQAGSWLAYKGSHDILEIAKNLGSAVEKLKLKVGDVVSITKFNQPESKWGKIEYVCPVIPKLSIAWSRGV